MIAAAATAIKRRRVRLNLSNESNTGPVSGSASEVSIERPALYVVATPIGNLSDITVRAIAVLNAVDLVLCEDSRHSSRLLDHYQISTPTRPLHDHNEAEQSPKLIAQAAENRLSYALISDAGTPLISDPGYRLVQSAIEAGVPVHAVPGPSAVVAALSVAGLKTDRFSFVGFLPASDGARNRCLHELQAEPSTLVFYEAPHRIVATLKAMNGVFGGERRAVVSREMTKRFESIYRGTIRELVEVLEADKNGERGEFVIVVDGAGLSVSEAELDRVITLLLEVVDRKEATRLTTEITGERKNRVYARILELSRSDSR